jgi:uncharacterized RDD family membrane protein YckC
VCVDEKEFEMEQATGGTALALPAGIALSSSGRRLGSAILDGVLITVTLGIGWLIWSFFTMGKGQTPGKKMLGMRVISVNNMQATTLGMTFLREYIVKGIIGSITFGIAYLWLLWDKDKQALYDKVMGTVVVDDKDGRTVAGAGTPAVSF